MLLIYSEYLHQQLSQSHDSVFSETAMTNAAMEHPNPLVKKKRQMQSSFDQNFTAKSRPERFENQHLSERNPSSLGITSTPINVSKNINETMTQSTGGMDLDSGIGCLQSEVSLSMLSMNSGVANAKNVQLGASRELSNGNDYHQQSQYEGYVSMNPPTSYYNGNNADAIDDTMLCPTNPQTLSHSAAKHKMAIRPMNRKAPSRQCRNYILSKVNCTFKLTSL